MFFSFSSCDFQAVTVEGARGRPSRQKRLGYISLTYSQHSLLVLKPIASLMSKKSCFVSLERCNLLLLTMSLSADGASMSLLTELVSASACLLRLALLLVSVSMAVGAGSAGRSSVSSALPVMTCSMKSRTALSSVSRRDRRPYLPFREGGGYGTWYFSDRRWRSCSSQSCRFFLASRAASAASLAHVLSSFWAFSSSGVKDGFKRVWNLMVVCFRHFSSPITSFFPNGCISENRDGFDSEMTKLT